MIDGGAGFDFGDLATSQDFGAYFQAQALSRPSAPAFAPETFAPGLDPSGGGPLTDFAGAAKSARPWLQLGTAAMGAVSGVQAAHAAGQQAKTAERAQKVRAESARQRQQVGQPAAAFRQKELSQAAAEQIPG